MAVSVTLPELQAAIRQVSDAPYTPEFHSNRGWTDRQCTVLWNMTRHKILAAVDDLLMLGTSPDVCYQLLLPWVK